MKLLLLSISATYYFVLLRIVQGKGIGEGGQRGLVPPHFQKWGAQVGLSPPTFDRPSVLI